MASEYCIRLLPKKSIVRKEEKTITGKNVLKFEIPSGTFEGIDVALEIRPRAADFAMYSMQDVYAVIHEFSGKPQCLFLFKFVRTNSEKVKCICRCLGKRAVRKHWNPLDAYLSSWMP